MIFKKRTSFYFQCAVNSILNWRQLADSSVTGDCGFVYLHGEGLQVVHTLEALRCEVVDAVLAAQAG